MNIIIIFVLIALFAVGVVAFIYIGLDPSQGEFHTDASKLRTIIDDQTKTIDRQSTAITNNNKAIISLTKKLFDAEAKIKLYKTALNDDKLPVDNDK